MFIGDSYFIIIRWDLDKIFLFYYFIIIVIYIIFGLDGFLF